MLIWNKKVQKDQAGNLLSEGYKAQVPHWGEASVHPHIHHPGEIFLDCPALGIHMHPLGQVVPTDALKPAEAVLMRTLEQHAVWCLEANLHYYQEYGAKEDAIQQFFADEIPDGQFHSDYAMDGLREAAFLAYIQDPDGFIQSEAVKHIKTNQEKFLLEFLENEALLAEYQALIQDTSNPIHRMRAITKAVKASGGKTVTVTVQKEGQELTFKAEASSLTGCRSYYSTYDIQASDRRMFEELFGRHVDYTAEDITRITYGRNTIYEAAPAQIEELEEEPEMGGMQFG